MFTRAAIRLGQQCQHQKYNLINPFSRFISLNIYFSSLRSVVQASPSE